MINHLVIRREQIDFGIDQIRMIRAPQKIDVEILDGRIAEDERADDFVDIRQIIKQKIGPLFGKFFP